MSTVRNRIERWINASWYGPFQWTLIFLPLFPIVWSLVWLKRRVTAHKAQPIDPRVPVIVVGGITAGGTGKTPCLIALSQTLIKQGYNVGVVSRGYGRRSPETTVLVEAADNAAAVGDEPLLIKRTVPAAHVLVAQSRQEAVLRLLEAERVDVILSDDGLQHYSLYRDLEILVMDASRSLGNGFLLPVGPLREPRSRLATVDCVLVRNGDDPETSFVYVIRGFRNEASGERLSLDAGLAAWQGAQVVAATGLGQPDQYFQMLSRKGLIFESVAVADHAVLPMEEITANFLPDVVLITEKDAVKLKGPACDNVWVVEIEALLPSHLVNQLERLMGQRDE
ncbi:MAG: tetraacyldisaccharide 4'-kinase [Luminiphilus sp.]|nr:tetraacyldisaccharide 4'-kinase [Luminiphilus sp.]MDG1508131.1 tetraacyldisaccharide 4'-kinase [Luminiphilus sp.]